MLPVLLALAFPALAHASVTLRSPALALAAGMALLLLLVMPLRHRPGRAALLLLLGTAGLVALAALDRLALLLSLPPVVLNAMIGFYFARSLRPGQMPLIERVVRALNQGQVPHPEVPAYARRLTRTWATMLLTLAAINLLLAVFAAPGGWLVSLGWRGPTLPASWWSLCANVLNYVVIAGFFLLEYGYRQWRFPEHNYGGLIGFLRRMGSLGPDFWRSR